MIAKWALRGGIALVGLVVVLGALLFIAFGNPLKRPSAAAKIQPKIEKAVAVTQVAQDKATDKAEGKTKTAAAAVDQRTDNHVADIRKSTARALPADVPDDAFCRGVRASKLYAGTPPGCGYSGKP